MAEFLNPPESRQHFDIWEFQTADGDSSHFGRMPPRIHLPWQAPLPGWAGAPAKGGSPRRSLRRYGKRVA
jgi:hypothetical protein